MTRDNLAKRGIERSLECVYCSEKESIDHLFFGCVVAKQIWCSVSEFFSCELGVDYFSIAKYWPANKKHTALNSICTCVLWGMWKHRNSHVFNNTVWIDLKQIWRLMPGTMRKWMILFKDAALLRIDEFSQRISLILVSWYFARQMPWDG